MKNQLGNVNREIESIITNQIKMLKMKKKSVIQPLMGFNGLDIAEELKVT